LALGGILVGLDPSRIPVRTYLDTSVLQTLHTYSEFVYENVELDADDRIHHNPQGVGNLEALRAIMQVQTRAQFQFIVSDSALQEVANRQRADYLYYALDVRQYSDDLLDELGEVAVPGLAALLDHKALGFLGSSDRQLLKEAVALGCDAFMTMENRLPRNSDAIHRVVGIRVLSPTGFWERLQPFAALWY
jgi:hypothetical protein